MSETINKSATCCFTGHRASKLPWRDDESDIRCAELKKEILCAAERLHLSGTRLFICGMANGCDMYFGEAVTELRLKYPDILLEAAVPWEGQAEKWASGLKERYLRLISECDYHTVVSKTYTPDCMKRRNHYMVDSSSSLIAAYNGSPGGTRQTMLYALRKGLELIEIKID
ncbi:MAG: DUF1273 domain-containing protein [Oscillospiraceae bacterium]|nr:DUF1273 domain-containing protein [Oscillospiraceae bacterium]